MLATTKTSHGGDATEGMELGNLNDKVHHALSVFNQGLAVKFKGRKNSY
jgi:hypothetical protein